MAWDLHCSQLSRTGYQKHKIVWPPRSIYQNCSLVSPRLASQVAIVIMAHVKGRVASMRRLCTCPRHWSSMVYEELYQPWKEYSGQISCFCCCCCCANTILRSLNGNCTMMAEYGRVSKHARAFCLPCSSSCMNSNKKQSSARAGGP